ncbi:MAG: cohesin domain-containing protein, partial [Bacteroidota bacterium]
LADSETDVVFSNTPIGIEAFDNNLNPFNIITDDGTINAGSVGGPSCNDGVQNGDETGVDCGGSCAPCSAGGDELTFSLSDGNGSVGQQVCLDLTTSNHTDIAAWQFSINFDTDFLAYTNFTSNPAYGAMNSEIQVFNSAPGVLRVIWSDNTTDFDGFSFPDGTVLATFCFTIVDAGPTTVDITNDPIVIIAANAMGQTLPVTTNDGSVNGGVTATCDDGIQNGNETGVDCGGDCTPCVSCDNGIQDGGETGVDCGGPDCAPCNPGNGDELVFDLQDGSGGVGSQVCLDITTANFTQITAFQFSVNFDGAFLDFASSSYNSAFDDAGSPVLINEDSNGDIRIIWVDNLLNGVTLPDGATVITLCFNVLNDGQTNVA